MATNYEVRYYNWTLVLKNKPNYETRIFGSLKDAERFMEQKLDEFLQDLNPEVRYMGDSGFDSKKLAIWAWFYDEDHSIVDTYIYLEEITVDELEF